MTPPFTVESPSIGSLLTGWRLVTSIAGIFLIAWLAGRLLGARRTWATVVISAAVGWVAGATLSVILAKSHEHGSSGFTRNLWLFSAFFTMSATVWIEMLHKPGALARAQSGLISVPHPVRSVMRRSQRLSRYAQITRIAARHGLGRTIGVSDEEVGEGTAPLAVRVRRALEDAGGMFVKLGQVLSTRNDLLPASFTRELSRLQDQVAPASRPEVERAIVAELGRPVTEVFAKFDWEPLAAASIGQAYRARLPSGEPVVVKVQRPGIDEAVERDLDVLRQLSETLEARVPWAVEYRVSDFVKEFGERLREELDFRIEARNAAEIAARIPAGAGVTVPRVHENISTSRVLVMEWFEGMSARDLWTLDIEDSEQVQLADSLLRCSLQQMLVDGLFHSDPHPGNVMVLRDGSLGLIDFGAVGRLDNMQQASLRQVMLAVAQRDPNLLRQAVLEVATLHRGFDDDQFERELARFMTRYLGRGSKPSAAMFTALLQLLFSFRIVLPTEFSTFFRALVTLEGTLTTLCPGYLVIEKAQTIAAEWFSDQLDPAALEQLARDELLKLTPVLRRLPRHLDRLATIAERGDLRVNVSAFSTVEDERAISKLMNRVLLAFLGGAVSLVSVILIGIRGGPAFSGRTTLYEFFGYFGLFCGTVLIMRVLVAIFRDGPN